MGKLTTHVLDTAHGKPGSGVKIRLFSLENGRHLVASAETNDNGRTDHPLMDDETYREGVYELEYSIGEYFNGREERDSKRPFLDDVVIRVTLSGDDHYHVPLLVTPWSYSTYRGS